MTENQKDIIRHTQNPGQGRLAGLFVTGSGEDGDDCLALVETGHMENLGKLPFCPDTVFRTTAKGRDAILTESF